MTLKLPYGDDALPLARNFPVISPPSLPPPIKEETLIEILSKNIPQKPLKEIALVFPDATRPLPAAYLLRLLLPLLKTKKLAIFVGGGTHTLMNKEALKAYLGPLPTYGEVFQNCPHDLSWYRYLGETSRRTPIYFPKKLLEADYALFLTLLRPHYYAGFSGGRKLLLPGLAPYCSIQANHKLVLDPQKGSKHAKAVVGVLKGNPVHEDMEETAKIFPIPHRVLGFIESKKQLHGVVAFTFQDSFEEVIKPYLPYFSQGVQEKTNLLFLSAGGYPKDINFIQAHKALEHVFPFMKEGGQIFMACRCQEGLGSKEMENFLRMKTPSAMVDALFKEFRIYGHTALSWMMKRNKVKVHLYTEMPDDVINLLGASRWDGGLPTSSSRGWVVLDGSSFFFRSDG